MNPFPFEVALAIGILSLSKSADRSFLKNFNFWSHTTMIYLLVLKPTVLFSNFSFKIKYPISPVCLFVYYFQCFCQRMLTRKRGKERVCRHTCTPMRCGHTTIRCPPFLLSVWILDMHAHMGGVVFKLLGSGFEL